MAGLPTGTVTFVFTDVEGSTMMWERDATTTHSALARHDEILRSAIEESGGRRRVEGRDTQGCADLGRNGWVSRGRRCSLETSVS